MATIAIQDTFLEAYAQLPKSEQRRTREMIGKLRQDPFSPGLNFEKLKAVDPKLYSLRVNDCYRTIVVKPDHGDSMLLVWVDHHDEAYEWASRRRFVVNPHSGVIQMWNLSEASMQEVDQTTGYPIYREYGLFSRFSSSQLEDIGVPNDLVPAIRQIQTLEELDAKEDDIPGDVMEALRWLASGDPYDEVLRIMSELQYETKQVQCSDFDKAIQHPNSSRHVVIITDDDQLNEILDKPLEKWRVFLHPSQKSLVERDYQGPVRVLGGAGTGKTVVAMHRARRLARELISTDEKVLVTTYTLNLAEYISETLKTMCTVEEMEKLEVISIDKLARQIVDRYVNDQLEVVWDQKQLQLIWLEALQLAGWSEEKLSFIMQEYEYVIQNHGIKTWEEYQATPRTGRGQRLTQAERELVWSTVSKFRERMKEYNWVEFTDVLRLAREWLEAHPGVITYRSAIVDEGQDFHPEAFKLLRALVPVNDNDLFIVGDTHQRIYARHVVLGRCGIDIRGHRSKYLRINYRTTEQIREQAVKRLSGIEFDDLDGGKILSKDTSLIYGQPPVRKHFATEEEEQQYLVEQIQLLLSSGIKSNEIAILTRKNKMVETIKRLLEEHDIPAVTMNPRYLQHQEGINCGTMHRSKGLEFRVVFITSVNEEIVPPVSQMQGADEVTQEELLRQERCLLYVASTRARDYLYVTSYGTASVLWPVEEKELVH